MIRTIRFPCPISGYAPRARNQGLWHVWRNTTVDIVEPDEMPVVVRVRSDLERFSMRSERARGEPHNPEVIGETTERVWRQHHNGGLARALFSIEEFDRRMVHWATLTTFWDNTMKITDLHQVLDELPRLREITSDGEVEVARRIARQASVLAAYNGAIWIPKREPVILVDTDGERRFSGLMIGEPPDDSRRGMVTCFRVNALQDACDYAREHGASENEIAYIKAHFDIEVPRPDLLRYSRNRDDLLKHGEALLKQFESRLKDLPTPTVHAWLQVRDTIHAAKRSEPRIGDILDGMEAPLRELSEHQEVIPMWRQAIAKSLDEAQREAADEMALDDLATGLSL